MKIILLSGGAGTRLWPLSNQSRSKQFLQLLPAPDGKQESMVQRIWRQLKEIGLTDSCHVSTSAAQVDIIQSQLHDEAKLIIEPCQHDTFAAISLAAVYLHSVMRVDADETICILPVDCYVAPSFFHTLQNAEEALNQSQASLALIGVCPSYPNEQYGYIIPNKADSSSFYSFVQQFVEKPDTATAEKLLAQGALWNCGTFIFKLGYLLELLQNRNICSNYNEFIRNYTSLPKKSFDYEVVEHTSSIVTVPYNGYWTDLGTWSTLTDMMDCCVHGKGTVDPTSPNTSLINELNIPIAVIGTPDTVVAASPDGILVSNKSTSNHLKQFVQGLQKRPMYEEKRWGWYRVLDHDCLPTGEEVLTKRLKLLEGKNLSYQLHQERHEIWTIISGRGIMALEGTLREVQPGDVIQIPAGAKHAAKAITDLEFIEVQMGTRLIEEDIVRICMQWEQIEQQLSE